MEKILESRMFLCLHVKILHEHKTDACFHVFVFSPFGAHFTPFAS